MVRILGLQGVRNEQPAIERGGATFLPEYSNHQTFRFRLNNCFLDSTEQQLYANLHSDGSLGSLFVVGEGAYPGQDLRRGELNVATQQWLLALLLHSAGGKGKEGGHRNSTNEGRGKAR